MAKYTPNGWTMSPAGQQTYMKMVGRIDAIVQKRVRKYNLPTIDRDDLLQEGRLAAAYAVDTFNEGRGSLDSYVSRVVDNALAMVACEALAQKRQPYAWSVNQFDEWVKSPLPHTPLEDIADRLPSKQRLEPPVSPHRECFERAAERMEMNCRLEALPLSPDARKVMELKLSPPPELQITARNMNTQMRIDVPSLAAYLSWTMARARRAVQEMKHAVGVTLGRVEAIAP